jgi:hypothetical protein
MDLFAPQESPEKIHKGITRPKGWSDGSWRDYIEFDPDKIFGEDAEANGRLSWVLSQENS